MRVKAIKSFVDGRYGRHDDGDIFDLPKGADWVAAGLVEPVEETIETAAIKPPRRATKKTNTPRKPRAKKKAAN